MRWVRARLTSQVVGWAVVAVVIAGTIALVVFALSTQQATIEALRDRNASLGHQIDEASSRYDRLFGEYSKLYDESKNHGVQPSTTNPTDVPDTATSGSTGPAGAAGAVGAQGPRGDMGVPGQTGPAGKDGQKGDTGAPGATGDTGPAGSPGTAGSDGAPGAQGVPGPQGATGPAGPAGKDGADGKDGRGIATVSCITTDTGTAFRFTFTDGTTTDVTGPCAPVPADTPTDAPTG